MPNENLRWLERPTLREPIMIAAFAGWNDASEVATTATKFLINQWHGRRFAAIEAEEFYVFTETRPTVRIVGSNQRRIDWPNNEFYHCASPDGARDYVILVGVEPQLRWQTFSSAVFEVAREIGVSLLVTFGGLLADVPHTMPPHLSATASSAKLQERLKLLQLLGTRYEGPTGILGVLGAAAREARIPSVSIWGSVPHYISTTGNPRVTSALLTSFAGLFDLTLDLSELERQSVAFDSQVNQAIAQNPEVADYVRKLEQREMGADDDDEPPASDQASAAPPTELPSSDVLLKEVEDFFRRSPGQPDEGKPE